MSGQATLHTQAQAAGTAKAPTHDYVEPKPPSPDAEYAGVHEEWKPSLRTVWVVLGRRKYDEPLYQIGTVTANTPEMAAVFAESIYDEHPWIEMVVVPRSSMRTVIAP